MGTGLTALHAQTPPAATPLPPVVKLPTLGAPVDVPNPMPTAEEKGVEGKPKPKPEVVPPMTEAIPAPTMQLFPSGCSTCGDVNPTCADPGCAGAMIPGPKDPVWMNNGVMLLWFQPQRGSFSLANGNLPGQGVTSLLSGKDELGKFIAPKIDGGLWLNKDHTVGAGIDGFITEQRSSFNTITGGPANGLSIQRPFVDAASGAQSSLLVAGGVQNGTIPPFAGSVGTAVSARLASIGAHLRRNVVSNDTVQLDLMYGFRHYDLEETLNVYQNTTLPTTVTLPAFPGGAAAGGTAELQDRVFTRNQFYGGELGARLELNHSLVTLAFQPKLAFGEVHQITQIFGQTKVNGATQPGGLLAAGAAPNGNMGRFITNRFAVATDAGLELGIHINKNTRLALGYQFYYLNTVARPSQQIDQAINTRVVPLSPSYGSLTGPTAPNVTYDREGFYAHGVSILLEARY